MAAITIADRTSRVPDMHPCEFNFSVYENNIFIDLILESDQAFKASIDTSTIKNEHLSIDGSIIFSFRADGSWKFRFKNELKQIQTRGGKFEEAYFDIFLNLEDLYADFTHHSKLLDRVIEKAPQHTILSYIQLRMVCIDQFQNHLIKGINAKTEN